MSGRRPPGTPVPVRLGGEQALLLVHSGCAEDDPYHRMFFLPADTLRLALFGLDGRARRLWASGCNRTNLGGL